ncbi:MAG TPA: hypothetical protein VK943_01570 [Arenibaculum sp.]|nr:hypothetical protein [Arenibaculum sp.]
MSDAPVPGEASADALLDEIGAAVAAARHLLAEGAVPDLTGLDLCVGQLCGLLERLGAEAGQPHLAALLHLSEALAALEVECARSRGLPPADGRADGRASARSRAIRAYAEKSGRR